MATRHLPVADLCGKCSAESQKAPGRNHSYRGPQDRARPSMSYIVYTRGGAVPLTEIFNSDNSLLTRTAVARS